MQVAVLAGAKLIAGGLSAFVRGVAPEPPRLTQAGDGAVYRGLAHVQPGLQKRLMGVLGGHALVRAGGEQLAYGLLLPGLIVAALRHRLILPFHRRIGSKKDLKMKSIFDLKV